MPLAVTIWLAIIWGFGLFLQSPNIEILTPPSIEARFVELSESKQDQNSSPSSSPRKTPQAKVQSRPVEPTPLSPPSDRNLEAPTDMMAYINQARARRRAAGNFNERENAEATAPGREQSEEEIRMANIKRNLQAPGTNGIFRIVRMGARTAEFTFRGWTTDPSSSRLELIEVQAGPDGDVERAIVRRMIQLIRQYHEDTFNWESPRLNRVVVLSARIQDNVGLEDFMMREFFGESVSPFMR
ncbi:MAG: hypothetical protein SCG79_02910 [Nitrosomonadaceae bacterium]|nr:hypothetical protein [Nitrosomonadaceae bacterium]MDW7597717.1 hypothetical protein [Nitrosomonadaceae bacterium]